MGIFIGYDGRLFACPDTSSVSQIPQIHAGRSSVPVQGTPIRPLDKSFRVYTPYEGHCISKEKGDNSTSLSRRLVVSKPKPSKTVGTQTIHFVTDHFTRSDHQLREIRPSANSSVHIHRDGVSDSYQYLQGTANQPMKILETVRMVSQKTSISARDFLSLLGQLNAAADFVMLGRLHLWPLQMSLHNQWQPQKLPLCHQICMTTKILQHLKWWLQEDRYYQGVPLKIDPSSHTFFTHASLSGWGAHVEPEGLLFHGLSMDRRTIPAPHQCARDESNFSLSITSSSQGKELLCVGVNGQHHSGSLYKASGRDSFHRTLRRSVERPELVLSPQHTSVSKAHTGQVKHSSRPDVSNRQTDLHRVVPESGNSKQDFPDHGLSINRPVRHTSEPQAANICVTHTGSEGAINRCPLDGLESHAHICVSTVSSHSSCDKQNTVIPVQDSIDSTSMARQTMVIRAPRSVGVTTGISASNSKPASSAKRQNSASKPGPSTASRLGIVKQSLRDKQFSSEVAEHVSKARRVY